MNQTTQTMTYRHASQTTIGTVLGKAQMLQNLAKRLHDKQSAAQLDHEVAGPLAEELDNIELIITDLSTLVENVKESMSEIDYSQ